MKRLFFFVLTCFIALSLSAQDYVDLGLPSGTLWKDANEKGFFYKAMEKASSAYQFTLRIVQSGK